MGQAATRVDKLLASLLEGVTRATIQRWLVQGRVTVQGKPCRARDKIAPGALVQVVPGPRPKSAAEPDSEVRFEVLYEDEHLIVVDKPAGLVVHPARGHSSGTLVNGLLARPGFGVPPADPRDREGSLRPGIVQRLDKDTSGVMVVAKSEQAREGLKAQLASHEIDRVYCALTAGVPSSTVIETLHARHPRSRLKFTSFTDKGRRAVTRIALREVFGAAEAALVECRLATGRTHQIRVHLSERANTPILADVLYGSPPPPRLVSAVVALGRQGLHAANLGFLHPATGESLRFDSPLPRDMQAALRELRGLRGDR